MQAGKRERIDKLLVDRALVDSREKARSLILAGRVAVKGMVVSKAGTAIAIDSPISIKDSYRYVGRGGIKLEGALDYFKIAVAGSIVLDVGSSTGGFTDCLLKRNAERVYAVDVGRGILDWKIRNDPRVKVLEGRNVRYLEFDEVGEYVDLGVIDVSFISLEKVIPRVCGFLKKRGKGVLALIKPQFEVGKGQVGKGGIVRDPEKHQMVIDRIKEFSKECSLSVNGVFESPIKGAKGNREFWIWLSV